MGWAKKIKIGRESGIKIQVKSEQKLVRNKRVRVWVESIKQADKKKKKKKK